MRLYRIARASIESRNVTLYVAQDNYKPAVVGGNKRFKLEDNLREARMLGYAGVLGIGGAYSNFLHSLAYLARQRKLPCVGVVRGEVSAASNPTLTDARRWGMQLEFVSRAEFAERDSAGWWQRLTDRFPGLLCLPEGGSNGIAVQSCPGATATGLSLCLHDKQQLRGYSVVHDAMRKQRMRHWLQTGTQLNQIKLIEVHNPKYGRLDTNLCRYIDDFYLETNLLLDPLYTSKAMQQLECDIHAGEVLPGSVVLLVHTGGLQGWRGFLSHWRSQLSSETLARIDQETAFTEVHT